jgi:hypothetical protein
MPLHVDIINVADDMATMAVRSVLEYLGCRVTMHSVVTARHLVNLLSGREPLTSSHLLLMCRGAAAGLLLPELTPDQEAQQPYHGFIRPSQFGEFVNLPGKIVLNNGCSLGTPDYAGAFLHGNCHTYIGAMADPSGDAALYYVLNFYYELLHDKSIQEAHATAAVQEDDRRMFVLYSQSL